MPIFLLLLLVNPSVIFAANSVFTNSEYKITSFTDIESQDKSFRYIVKSYNRTIYFDFPVSLSLMSKIKVYGVHQGSAVFVNDSNNLILLSKPLPFFEKFARFRIRITRFLLKDYPKSAGFIIALALGNKSFLSPDFLDFVRAAGVAHILALSGLHFVIFISIFSFLARLLPISQRWSSLVMIIPALFYLCLGGMGVSLQRAFLFYLIWIVLLWHRLTLPANKVLILALIFSCLISPQSIFSLSFVLSYSAVAGIIFFQKYFYNKCSKFLHVSIANLVSVSISAGMTVLPLLIWNFGEFNLLFVLSSVIIVSFMPFVIMLCFIAVSFAVLDVSWNFLDQILEFFYLTIFYISKKIAIIPYTMIFLSNPKLFVVSLLSFVCIIAIIKYKFFAKEEL